MMQMYKNTPLFYSSIGFGNPIVLLHGFLESSTIWNPFTKALSEKRQVIVIDLPGHGKSGTFGKVHSMEFMAKAVQEILNQLGVKKAFFVGHSMGGYVSLAFLEQFPESINGIMLLNSSSENDTKERKQNRDRAIKIVKQNKNSFVSMAISNLLSELNSKKFPEELAYLKNEALLISEKGITAALEGMKIRTDKTTALSNFNEPKYIIAGEDDQILAISDAKRVAETTNCKLISFLGGHLSFIEHKEEVKKLLLLID